MGASGIRFDESSKEILGPNAGTGFDGLNINATEEFSAIVDWNDMKAQGLHAEFEVDRETDAGPDDLIVKLYHVDPTDTTPTGRFDLSNQGFTIIGLASLAVTRKLVYLSPSITGRHFVYGFKRNGTDDLFNAVITIRPFDERS